MAKKKEKVKVNENLLKIKYKTFENRVFIRSAICALSFILALVCIIFSFKVNVDTNLRYYQKSNVDYKVNLKPNEFYAERSLGKNMQYIASLIDNIDATFNYNFSTSDKLNYRYSYDVTADVQIKDSSSGNVILSKKENILNTKTESKQDSDQFILKQNIKIDYERYNGIAKRFKSQYALSADSNLVVSMNIKVMDENGNTYENLSANNKMSIVIPLSTQTINIKLDYKEINNSDTIIAHTDFEIANKPLFTAGVVFGFVFLISLVLLFKFISVLFKKKTKYDKALAKILREYDRIIVETRTTYTTSEQDIIDVKSFNEILDARDNLEKPILFKEVHKGAKAEFLVKNSYEVYRYVLKAVDLEEN